MARLPLISPLDRALFLKAQPYLDGLPPNLLALLAATTEEVFFPAGAHVLRARDPIDTVYFFGSGAFEIIHGDGDRSAIFELTAPGVVGLTDHLAQTIVPPAVRAAVDTFCLAITTEDLDQILEDFFPLVHQIARASCDSVIRARIAQPELRSDEPGFPPDVQPAGDADPDLVQCLALARRAPFLSGTNLTLLAELIKSDEPERIAPGEPLWRADDPIDRMALVLDGAFVNDGRHGLARAGAGATLGAWEIAATRTRFEGWVAEMPSRILSIERELFIDLLEDHFEFAQAYLARVSEEITTAIRARAWRLRDAGATDRAPRPNRARDAGFARPTRS
ncbi:MAG: cyclic nucleotide-binding domain-containing protein [Myxococcota bacterium]